MVLSFVHSSLVALVGCIKLLLNLGLKAGESLPTKHEPADTTGRPSRRKVGSFVGSHQIVVVGSLLSVLVLVYLIGHVVPVRLSDRTGWLLFFDASRTCRAGSPRRSHYSFWPWRSSVGVACNSNGCTCIGLIWFRLRSRPANGFRRSGGAAGWIESLVREPHSAIRGAGGVVVWVILVYTARRLIFSDFVPTVEGGWIDSLLLLALALLSLLLLYALFHVRALWKGVQEVLKEMARLPMAPAYDRIPRTVSSMFGPYLTSERPDREAHQRSHRLQRRSVQQEYQSSRPWLQMALRLTPETMQGLGVDEILGWPPAAEAASVGALSLKPEGTKEELHQTAWACLVLLQQLWSTLPLPEAFGEHRAAATDGAHQQAHGHAAQAAPRRAGAVVALGGESDLPRVQAFRHKAEDYVALQLMSYLSQFFVQLRNAMLFLTLAPLFMLLAVLTYPLQPQRLWLLAVGVLIIAIMIAGLRVFVQMERNEVISRISKSAPNQVNLNWSFLGNVLTYTVPLLGVLVAASLDLSDLVHSWLDPLFYLLK